MLGFLSVNENVALSSRPPRILCGLCGLCGQRLLILTQPRNGHPASACLILLTTVCARLSTTATSPSSKLNGSFANTISNPTVSRSYRTGAATIDRTPSLRQLSTSTRGSFSVSSQRTVFPARKHSPDNPQFTSNRVPTAGPLPPTLARHITPPL